MIIPRYMPPLGSIGCCRRAFSLPEVMIAMGLFVILVAGVISSHIFGMRLLGISTGKLTSSQDARKTVGKMVDEIRAARIATVGTGNESSFAGITLGSRQIGNALQINLSTNTNTFIRYFRDTTTKSHQPGRHIGGSEPVGLPRSEPKGFASDRL